jgi:hypothetical protein
MGGFVIVTDELGSREKASLGPIFRPRQDFDRFAASSIAFWRK